MTRKPGRNSRSGAPCPEGRFCALAANAHDAIARFDREGRFLYASPSAARLLGLPDDAIVGKTAEELGRDSGGAESWESRLRGVFASGQPQRFDERTVDGRWYDVRLVPEQRGSEVETVLSFARDITERKRAEEELRAANQRLADADRRKNEFLAVLSHELRNPLTPIRNSLFILEHALPGSEQARHAVEVMARQTGQLVRLVDDLLDITRVSRNKIQLRRRPLDLNEVVRRTVEDHRSLFEGKRIRIETSFEPERLAIRGDEVRLTQVVGNILQNAAKFTPAGGLVGVGTRLVASRGRAAFRIVDTGVGMEPEMLRRLFEPFLQANLTLDRSAGGLGLGLALVKGVVELHGGEVCAHSDGAGKGTELVVELPLERAAAAASDSALGVTVRARRRVLIIEDKVDAADSLRAALELAGHVVEVASDGPQGLAAARAFHPEFVLCDIGLPGMDGFEVARAFRADGSLAGSILVALSGYALPEDRQRAVEAGFDRHLAKPPSMEKLAELLASTPE